MSVCPSLTKAQHDHMALLALRLGAKATWTQALGSLLRTLRPSKTLVRLGLRPSILALPLLLALPLPLLLKLLQLVTATANHCHYHCYCRYRNLLLLPLLQVLLLRQPLQCYYYEYYFIYRLLQLLLLLRHCCC